jgi:hypothetical protein
MYKLDYKDLLPYQKIVMECTLSEAVYLTSPSDHISITVRNETNILGFTNGVPTLTFFNHHNL